MMDFEFGGEYVPLSLSQSEEGMYKLSWERDGTKYYTYITDTRSPVNDCVHQLSPTGRLHADGSVEYDGMGLVITDPLFDALRAAIHQIPASVFESCRDEFVRKENDLHARMAEYEREQELRQLRALADKLGFELVEKVKA